MSEVEVWFSEEWQPPDLSHLPESDSILDKVKSNSEEQQKMDGIEEVVQNFHSEMPNREEIKKVNIYDPEDWPEEMTSPDLRSYSAVSRSRRDENIPIALVHADSDGENPEEEVAAQLALEYFQHRDVEGSSRLFDEVEVSEHIFRMIIEKVSGQEFGESDSNELTSWSSPYPDAVEDIKREVNQRIEDRYVIAEEIIEKLDTRDYSLEVLWSIAANAPDVNMSLEVPSGDVSVHKTIKGELTEPLLKLESGHKISEGAFDEYRPLNSLEAVLEITGYEKEDIDRIEHDSEVDGYELEGSTLRVGNDFHDEWRHRSAINDIENQIEEMDRYRERFNENPEFWIWQRLKRGPLQTEEEKEFAVLEKMLEPVSEQLAESLEGEGVTAEIVRDPIPYAKFARDGIAMAYLAEGVTEEDYREALENAAREYGINV